MRGDIRPEAFSSVFSSFLRAVHSSSSLQGHCPSSLGGRGVGGGRWKRRDWDWEADDREGMRRGLMQHLLLLLVSSMAADTCSASSAPPFHPGWGGRREEVGQASACLVPGLGGDQRFTNDVYAVVLVDICWQNRSPVRHLEWN